MNESERKISASATWDRRTCVAQIENAMNSVKNNSSYRTAQERSPELIQTESDLLRFFRLEKFDASRTAQRLAAYWEKRVELFDERAFFPMTQTGEGALNRSDLNALSTSYFSFLQNDTSGCSVLCYDASKLFKVSKKILLRLAFYLFSVAAENTLSQTDGIVLIFVVGKANTVPDDPSLCSVLAAIPICFKAVHVVHSGKRLSMQKIAPAIGRLFCAQAAERTHLHASESKDQVAKNLESFGIIRTSLPISMGGEWYYGRFAEWLELRSRFEWGLPPGTNSTDMVSWFDFKPLKKLAELSEDQCVERKRKMNVLHSRRKRERERIEINVLEEQCSDLGDRNRALLEENREFQDLLDLAKMKIARFEDSTSNTDLLDGSVTFTGSRSDDAEPISTHKGRRAFSLQSSEEKETSSVVEPQHKSTLLDQSHLAARDTLVYQTNALPEPHTQSNLQQNLYQPPEQFLSYGGRINMFAVTPSAINQTGLRTSRNLLYPDQLRSIANSQLRPPNETLTNLNYSAAATSSLPTAPAPPYILPPLGTQARPFDRRFGGIQGNSAQLVRGPEVQQQIGQLERQIRLQELDILTRQQRSGLAHANANLNHTFPGHAGSNITQLLSFSQQNPNELQDIRTTQSLAGAGSRGISQLQSPNRRNPDEMQSSMQNQAAFDQDKSI